MNPQRPPFSPQGPIGQINAQMNQGQPAMNQVTTQSPNFNPSMQAPPNAPMPQKSPMQGFTQGLAQKPSQGQSAPQNPLQSRADLIVKALTSHLASIDKMLGQGQPNQPNQPQPIK